MIDKKLQDYLDCKRTQEFQWGVCDCVLFTCDWCEILTGSNPAEGAHGQYDSELSAYKFLKKEYGNDPARYIDSHFNRVDNNFAQKGDICLCDLDGKDTFGIICSGGFVVFKMQIGLIYRKDVERKICWRVE